MGVFSAFSRFSRAGWRGGGGGGGGGAHVPSNTEYFNVLLEVGGGGGGKHGPPGDAHDLLPLLVPQLLPLPTTCIPLVSEVTSMVTYVMMTNLLIHYCQSMKHIYMDTIYKLS